MDFGIKQGKFFGRSGVLRAKNLTKHDFKRLASEPAGIFRIGSKLSPSLALWVRDRFEIDCFSVGYIGYRDADDVDIFFKARELDAIVLTKDEDFCQVAPPARQPTTHPLAYMRQYFQRSNAGNSGSLP